MMRLEYVSLDEVRRWPRNPKAHRRDLLEQSLGRFGFTTPLVLDERTGQLVAGHGRLDALESMRREGKPPPVRVLVEGGIWKVPIVRGVTFKDDIEAEAYLVADNRLTEVGGWDSSVLSGMLKDIALDDGLLGTGFDSLDVAKFLVPVEVPVLDDGASPPSEGLSQDRLSCRILFDDLKQKHDLIAKLRTEGYKVEA